MDKFCKDCKNSFFENTVLCCRIKFGHSKDNKNGAVKVYFPYSVVNLKFDCKDFEEKKGIIRILSKLFNFEKAE